MPKEFSDKAPSIELDVFNQAPEKAARFFKKKGYKFTWNWEEMLEYQHQHAFTVAKAMKADILQDIRGMVQKALDEGIEFEEFVETLKPNLQKAGWWGKKEVDGKVVELGSPRRLKTIYETNLSTAYTKGRWKGQKESKSRRYLQYIVVRDENTREKHLYFDKKVFAIDDPIWNYLFPPNDWGCRCGTRSLSLREIEREGLEISNSKGNLTFNRVKVRPDSNKMTTVTTYTDPVTRKSITTAPGWNINVGEEEWKPDLSKYDADIRRVFSKEK